MEVLPFPNTPFNNKSTKKCDREGKGERFSSWSRSWGGFVCLRKEVEKCFRRAGRVEWVVSGDGESSLLIWAADVQRVNHKGQVWPGWYHGVAWLHHLKADVVERLDDGNWWRKRQTEFWSETRDQTDTIILKGIKKIIDLRRSPLLLSKHRIT